MTERYDDALLDEAASRLVDDREYMVIYDPDETEPAGDAGEADN